MEEEFRGWNNLMLAIVSPQLIDVIHGFFPLVNVSSNNFIQIRILLEELFQTAVLRNYCLRIV